MSAPDKDIETQKIAYWILEESASSDTSRPEAEQTEGATVPMENVEEGTLGGADPVADPGAESTQTPGPAEEGTAPAE